MMSEPMDPTRQQTAQPQGMSPEVLRDIEEFLEDGRLVFDQNGELVGGVKMYSTAAGYLLVGSGALGHQDLYIPFRLIRRIDTQGIVLSEPKYLLVDRYAEPPATHTLVEQRFAPGAHHDTIPQAYEMRVVQSGYDDAPTTVDSIEMAGVAERLSVGLAVYDVDGVRLGDITEYDTARSLLVMEKSIFTPTVLLVPFSAIKVIDRDAGSVILTLPRAILMQDQATLRSQLE